MNMKGNKIPHLQTWALDELHEQMSPTLSASFFVLDDIGRPSNDGNLCVFYFLRGSWSLIVCKQLQGFHAMLDLQVDCIILDPKSFNLALRSICPVRWSTVRKLYAPHFINYDTQPDFQACTISCEEILNMNPKPINISPEILNLELLKS